MGGKEMQLQCMWYARKGGDSACVVGSVQLYCVLGESGKRDESRLGDNEQTLSMVQVYGVGIMGSIVQLYRVGIYCIVLDKCVSGISVVPARHPQVEVSTGVDMCIARHHLIIQEHDVDNKSLLILPTGVSFLGFFQVRCEHGQLDKRRSDPEIPTESCMH